MLKALSVLLVASCANAFAVPTIEVGAGFTKYGLREDGIWWQGNSQLETHNDMHAQGYQLGARWDRWRVAFVHLGHFYGDNEFVGDGNVDHYPFRCPNDPGDCKMRAKLSGAAYGLSFGPVWRGTWRRWNGEVEGGGFLFRSYQKTNICPEDHGGPFTECFNYDRMWGVHRTWFVGAGLGRGSWMVNYRAYYNVYEQGNTMPGGDVGITGGLTQTVFLSVSF